MSVLQTMERIEQALTPATGPLPVTDAKAKERVRRHRERLTKEGCGRLDIMIGADVIKQLRTVAKQRGIPIWHAAEEAIGLLAAKYPRANREQ